LPPELDPNGDHEEPKLELDSDAAGVEVVLEDLEADFLRPPDFLAFDFLAADFFAPPFLAAPRFAADFFFFFAGAAFRPPFDFLVFDFRFFAIIVLPMVSAQTRRSCRHGSDPCLQCRRHPAPGRPVDQLDGVDHRD
jgi:hypothetical protein